jgi:hypothetical protein
MQVTDRQFAWFLGKVSIRDLSECWEFSGPRNDKGYGVVHIRRDGRPSRMGAHRFSHIAARGDIQSSTIMVCHRCDNPPCVNPAHLFLGTASENMLDSSRKGRIYRPLGELHHANKLTATQILEIRQKYSTGAYKQAELAREYGVGRRYIGLVKDRKVWRHI